MNNDEQAIRELIATWLSATKTGDTDKVLSLMTDDVVFLTAGNAPMRGKKTFADAQAQLKNVKIEATGDVQEIKVFGEWAYVWTQLNVVVTPPATGAPVRRTGPSLSILRKQAGKWLLFRDANMLAAAQ